jgi:outer membrane protein
MLVSVSFAEMKIGYIDSNKIMSEYEDVRQVQIELEKEQRRLQSELELKAMQLDSLRQDYDRQRLLMSDDRRQQKENEMIQLDKSIQQFQMEKFGPEGEIYIKQTKLLKPVLKKINEAIEKVGSERSYDLILDAQTGGIVYALESHNLTEDVLEELSKSTGSATE